MRAFEKKELERKEAQSARRKQHKIFVLCLLGAIVMTTALFFLTSCRSRVETVYVDKVKTEYRDVVRIDSVYNRDTVAIRLSGDTVYKDIIKWRERWQLRIDSFTRVDSVPYAVEVVREVNRLTAWQHRQIVGFWVALGAIGIWAAWRLRGLK